MRQGIKNVKMGGNRMDYIIKSSVEKAESESNSLKAKEGAIEGIAELLIGVTNLPVVDNLQNIHSRMNSCNESYKNLLKNNADSIKQLGQEFNDFDQAIADKMRISQ